MSGYPVLPCNYCTVPSFETRGMFKYDDNLNRRDECLGALSKVRMDM